MCIPPWPTEPQHVDARAENGPEEDDVPATRRGLRLAAAGSLALLAIGVVLSVLL